MNTLCLLYSFITTLRSESRDPALLKACSLSMKHCEQTQGSDVYDVEVPRRAPVSYPESI